MSAIRPSLSRLILSIALASVVTAVDAAQLQRNAPVSGSEIHLSDLFTDVDPDQDVVLGDAPAPGARITIGAAQLSAIASQFGVDWTSVTGREYRILRRDCTALDDAIVSQKFTNALTAAGLPADSVIAVNGHPPVVVENGSDAEVSSVVIDASGSSFHGEIVTKTNGKEVGRYPISGTIELTMRIMVASRDLPAGIVLDAEDLSSVQMAKSRAGGGLVQDAMQAVGQVTDRSVRAGTPVRLQDLHRPQLVLKGASVIMLLSGDGIDVSAQGQAIDGGALDDKVRVLNVASHAILTGDVIGPSQVKIAPHSIPTFLPSWRTSSNGVQRLDMTSVAAATSMLGRMP